MVRRALGHDHPNPEEKACIQTKGSGEALVAGLMPRRTPRNLRPPQKKCARRAAR